jgi:hypothetical protein
MDYQANSLYYLFSTISQTLGGTIALLGAFVLYRYQLIRNKTDSLKDYIDSLNTAARGITDAGTRIQKAGQDIKTMDDIKSKLSIVFLISLLITVITILYSVFVLWRVSDAVNYFNIISLIGLGGVIVCFGSYVFLILVTIEV